MILSVLVANTLGFVVLVRIQLHCVVLRLVGLGCITFDGSRGVTCRSMG